MFAAAWYIPCGSVSSLSVFITNDIKSSHTGRPDYCTVNLKKHRYIGMHRNSNLLPLTLYSTPPSTIISIN